MRVIGISNLLPPAITVSRTVIAFHIDQHLDEYGDTGLVARTWRGYCTAGPADQPHGLVPGRRRPGHSRRRTHCQRATPIIRPPPGANSIMPVHLLAIRLHPP